MAKISIDDKSPFDIENPKKPFARSKKSFLEQYQERKESKKVRSALTTHAIIAIAPEMGDNDPAFTQELDEGCFSIAGKFIEFDSAVDNPFMFHPISQRWESELHQFSWLKYLSRPQKSETDYSIFYAQNFTKGFLKENFEPDHMTWHYDIVARRLINWLSHSNLILPQLGHKLHKKIMRSMGEQLFSLANDYSTIPVNYSRMQAAHALLLAGLCIAGQKALYDKFMPRYLYELTTQILPDGSHISRNPETLFALISDLLQIRKMLEICGKEAHPRIEEKLPLMFKALRFMRLGDGKLARFNGVSHIPIGALSPIFYHDKSRLPTGRTLPDSKYFRFQAKEAVLLADGGIAPTIVASQRAHAGTSSFEFSTGIYPLIVNCGAAPFEKLADFHHSRSTVAHSTIGLGALSSASLSKKPLKDSDEEFDLLMGPLRAEGTFSFDDKQQILELSHNGFASLAGVSCHRKITLENTGLKLKGEERLKRVDATAMPEEKFMTRFHIHPDNLVELINPNTAHITLPNQQLWTFKTKGGQIKLADAIFYGGAHDPVVTPLLIINGPTSANQPVFWTLEYQEPTE